MSGFKEHPNQTKVAEDPEGIPSPLSTNEDGALLVALSAENSSTGAIETSSPTIHSILLELLREVKKSNIYLSVLSGEEILDSDIEE